MISQSMWTGFSKAVLVTFCMVLLTACGGRKDGESGEATNAVVSGSVGDGPITGATVEIYNVKGELISTETSDSSAAYKSRFKVHQRDYPLILKVSDGVDLVTGTVPDFELISVMMRSSNSTSNINPFSTLIVKMAQSMAGGINAENINYSTAVVMDKFSFGLDPDVIGDPVTNRISSKNIAQIVKASEALGEMLRRTRDQISAIGNLISGDDVVNAIASDIADGSLDGIGANGSDPTIAAVANVVTGQVLVEAMTNTLRVNGVVATVVIDQAISITHPATKSSQMSDSVRITSALLNQAKLSVAAAQVVDFSKKLAEVAADIDRISAGISPAEASSVVSTEASQWFDDAVTMAATADKQVVLSINLVANDLPAPVVENDPPPVVENDPPPVVENDPPPVVENDPPPVVENASPKITGSPASAVTASSTYSFKPGASDADGDELSFGIDNKPAWAGFNTSTGRLSGVPAEGDVGAYKNIVITVSDGVETASLTAFSIQVQTGVAATGNLDLSWTAPVARADGAPLSLADINGYRIYYGESEGQYTESAEITDGTAQSATVTGIPVGSYHVVMTTYDIDDRESSYSSSVIKSVQ